MPLNIGTGELASRLTKNYGVVGRLPLGLDESIVPVVLVDQLLTGPGPVTVRAGMAHHQLAAIALETNAVGVQVAPAMRLHVKGVTCFPSVNPWFIRMGIGPLTNGNLALVNINQTRGGNFGVPSRLASQKFIQHAVGLADGFETAVYAHPVFLPLDILLDGMLRPNDAIGLQPWVAIYGTVNTAINVTWQVEEYPGLAK